MSVHNSVACLPLVDYGTDAQKLRYLARLASGELLGAFALTEPQAGSDASALQTRAIRDGTDYIINGTKRASRFLSTFDAWVVDGIVNGMGYLTRGAAWVGGAIDLYIVDGLVNFVGFVIRLFGGGASRLQTGVIQNYVLAVFGGVIVLIVIMRLV